MTATIKFAISDRDDRDGNVAWLLRTITAVDGYTAQMRRAWAINAHERLAVAALWANGPMTMTELGAWIPLSRAAVTTLVDRLEGAGLVRRGSDPADRRRTVVEVSSEALQGMVPVLQPWADDYEALVEGFDAEEWAVVNRYLEGLRSVSTEHAARLKQLTDEQIRALAGEGR